MCVRLARRDEYLCNDLFTRENIVWFFPRYQIAKATLLCVFDSFSFFIWPYQLYEHVPRHVIFSSSINASALVFDKMALLQP